MDNNTKLDPVKVYNAIAEILSEKENVKITIKSIKKIEIVNGKKEIITLYEN